MTGIEALCWHHSTITVSGLCVHQNRYSHSEQILQSLHSVLHLTAHAMYVIAKIVLAAMFSILNSMFYSDEITFSAFKYLFFQILPLFVMTVVNWPGFPGIFLASLFSGSFR